MTKKPPINSGIHGGISLSGDLQELKDYYAQWSKNYDQDMIDGGYVGYRVIVEFFLLLRHFNSNITLQQIQQQKIFDAGCGTGLIGQKLAELGFNQIDGCDISNEMVAHAKQRQVYQNLYDDIDLTLPIANHLQQQYDSVLSSGMFTCGHVKPECLLNLLQLLKPNGTIIISTRDAYFAKYDYQTFENQLLQHHPIKKLTSLINAPYTNDGNAHYLCYQKIH